MKKFDEPQPVKLVCGLLFREEERLNRGLSALEAQFGERDFQSMPVEFSFTDYYFEEMGRPLYRMFASFERLIDPAALAEIKIFTNTLEENCASAVDGRRLINIDPGYLTPTAFILATSKNFAHRIYLGKGVFAQQELLFEKRRIQTLDWTYPDYRSHEYQEILKRIRAIYLGQLKAFQGKVI